jgi:DNA-binding transcriptional LysR family regulator
MTNLNDNQLRRLDATLLLVFQTAMETRKLGDVALRLGLTPSAISHALTRLRDIFEDPLFTRQHDGVTPTQRAFELLPNISIALAALRSSLALTPFHPASIERTFKIAALDYAIVIIGPELIRSITQHAPGMRLSFVSMGRADSLDAVMRGQIDISIGVFPTIDEKLTLTALTEDQFVVVARRGHRAFKKPLTIDSYAALDHIMVSGSGELSGPVDEALASLGKSRRVVAAVPQFLASLASVQISDAIASVPEKSALRYAKRLGLEIWPSPLQLPHFQVSAATRVVASNDLALQWLLEQMQKHFVD